MKKYILALLLLVYGSPMFAQTDTSKIQTTLKDSIFYTCPMHPEVISDKPDKCTKCGMDLVQKSSSPAEPKMDMMMCPMHGVVDMNHNHEENSNDDMKMMKYMGLAMGAMMVVMMTIVLGGL